MLFQTAPAPLKAVLSLSFPRSSWKAATSLTRSHTLPGGRLEQKRPRHCQAAGKQARVATHRGLQAELLTAAAAHLQPS